MPTTGTTEFNLDLNNLVEEAFERCGAQVTSGHDLRTARRSLNLLLVEWGNRGINLWTIDQYTAPLYPHSSIYILPIAMVDVLDCVVRRSMGTSVIDQPLRRVSAASYAATPNKYSPGVPTQVWINRQTGNISTTQVELTAPISATDVYLPVTSTAGLPPYGVVIIGGEEITYAGKTPDALGGCGRGPNATTHTTGDKLQLQRYPTATVWPVPAPGMGDMFLTCWYLRRMDDAGGGAATQDVPYRFIPALVAGLAYYLSAKIPSVTADRIMMLKQDYEEQWAMAATEDREKATLRIVPHIGRI